MPNLSRLLKMGSGLGAGCRALAGSPGAGGLTDVAVLDPLMLFETQRLRQWRRERAEGSSQGLVTLQVPDTMMPVLEGGGQLALGDMDDPMSSWQFGARGEIFQFSFVGTHTVASGWTCLCSSSVVKEIEQGTLQLGKWQAFLDLAQSTGEEQITGRELARAGLPLLFAGRLLDCPSASVYRLPKSGTMTGMLISNDFESIDD